MHPARNRWTGQPHTHQRERDRRARQLRHRFLRDFMLAQLTVAEVEHLFPDRDRDAYARKLGQLMAERTRET